MSDPVRVERNGPVTTVILNRPEARNAVNGPTAAALYAAFDEFDRDDSASVAVLWGDHGTFCAGADLKAFGTPDSQRRTPDGTRTDGAQPHGAVQTGDRRGQRIRRRRGSGVGVVVRSAGGRGGCRVRRVLPALGGAADRRRHRAAAAADRAQPGDGHDPHRPRGARRRSAGDRVGQSGGAQGPGPEAAEELAAELAALPQQCLRSDRLSALHQWGLPESEAIDHEFASISRVAAEAIEGRRAVRRGRRPPRRARTRLAVSPC